LFFNRTMKETSKLVWKWWTNLVVSDQWMEVCSWIAALGLRVSQEKAKDLLTKISEWVVEAATLNPGPKQGGAKWDFVWSKITEECGEWIEAHGEQIMELIALGMVRVCTLRNAAKIPKAKAT